MYKYIIFFLSEMNNTDFMNFVYYFEIVVKPQKSDFWYTAAISQVTHD